MTQATIARRGRHVLVQVLVTAVVAASAFAQDAPPAGQDAFDAFDRARSIARGEQPRTEAAPDVWAVAITLREGGQRSVTDAVAFDRARAGLIDAVARELPGPIGNDTRLTLELAGRPSPIDGARGLADVALAIRPGLDAVAVQAGDASAIVFPDAALANAMLPSDMLIEALRDALTDNLPAGLASEPGAWGRYADAALRSGEITAFRLPVTSLAQVGDAPAPRLLHRGGRIIEFGEITPQAMLQWAGGMADHLHARRYTGLEPYGLRGTLDPLNGEFLSPVDDPFAQALAAYALLRFGRSGWAPAAQTQQARTAGFVILRQLAFVTPIRIGAMADLGDRAPLEREAWAEPASAAMTLIAMEPLEAEAFNLYPELDSMRDRCTTVVRDAVGLSNTGDPVFDDKTPPASHALLARALVALGRSSAGAPADLQTGQAAARAVIERSGPALLVTQMPWALAALGPDDREANQETMLEMRRLILEHQLTGPEVDGDDRDLAGGIVFTKGGPPVPTWQTARAAVALGAMLNDPSLTPDADEPGRFLELLRTLRFLRQLTADESLDHLMAEPTISAGGVRAALWDQRQPSIATSLALLAACEALDAAFKTDEEARPDE